MISFAFIDFIIIVTGGYIVYSAIQMKQSRDITGSSLVGKGYDVKKAADPDGYIDYIFGKVMAIGIVSILGGILDILNEQYFHLPYVSVVSSILIFILIIVYCVVASKAQKKFLSPKPREKK